MNSNSLLQTASNQPNITVRYLQYLLFENSEMCPVQYLILVLCVSVQLMRPGLLVISQGCV